MGVKPIFHHAWNVTPAQARVLQQQLRERFIIEPLAQMPHLIAGIDVHVGDGRVRAGIVLMRYPELRVCATAVAERPLSFPYVPGLLAFREGPAVLEALAKLEQRPDVLMFDAQGFAHPRRCGLATHLGILLDMPSVGCAKSKLIGTYREPAMEKGAWEPLWDNGEIIGAVVRTRTRVRPVFVSIGHRIDLASAITLVLTCAKRCRLPEPTRWAHRVAGGENISTASPGGRKPTSYSFVLCTQKQS